MVGLGALDKEYKEHQNQMDAERRMRGTGYVKADLPIIGESMMNIPLTDVDTLNNLSAINEFFSNRPGSRQAAITDLFLNQLGPGTKLPANMLALMTGRQVDNDDLLERAAFTFGGNAPMAGQVGFAMRRAGHWPFNEGGPMEPEKGVPSEFAGGDKQAFLRTLWNIGTGFTAEDYNPYYWASKDFNDEALMVDRAYRQARDEGMPTLDEVRKAEEARQKELYMRPFSMLPEEGEGYNVRLPEALRGVIEQPAHPVYTTQSEQTRDRLSYDRAFRNVAASQYPGEIVWNKSGMFGKGSYADPGSIMIQQARQAGKLRPGGPGGKYTLDYPSPEYMLGPDMTLDLDAWEKIRASSQKWRQEEKEMMEREGLKRKLWTNPVTGNRHVTYIKK
jgi:hypothetical protein